MGAKPARNQRLASITVSDEFAEGYDAWARNQQPKDTNPYQPQSPAAIRWNAGWYAANFEDIADSKVS